MLINSESVSVVPVVCTVWIRLLHTSSWNVGCESFPTSMDIQLWCHSASSSVLIAWTGYLLFFGDFRQRDIGINSYILSAHFFAQRSKKKSGDYFRIQPLKQFFREIVGSYLGNEPFLHCASKNLSYGYLIGSQCLDLLFLLRYGKLPTLRSCTNRGKGAIMDAWYRKMRDAVMRAIWATANGRS